MFYKTVPTHDVTNPDSLPSFIVCMVFLSSLPLCNTSSFLTWSVQLIFLYPSPAPHFKTFHVFLTYFPKYPSFNTIQSHIPNIALHYILLAESYFCHGNHGFNFLCTSCIMCYHATQIFEIFHILQFFLSTIICIGDGCPEILISLVFPHSFPFHSIFQFQLVFHQSCPVASFFLTQ